jgi:hypothetical protein
MNKLTVHEAKRICRHYGLSRQNIHRMNLGNGITLDALTLRVKDVQKRKGTVAAAKIEHMMSLACPKRRRYLA